MRYPGGVTTPAPGLDSDEEAMWRSLVELMTRLPRVLDEKFVRETGVSMADYSVLVALSEAPGGELRMGDLAEAAALSRSRMSRVVEDMVRRSLVSRRQSENDARSSLAAITAEGRTLLAGAYPGHLARVRALVLDHVTRSEMRTMTAAFERIAAALRATGEPD